MGKSSGGGGETPDLVGAAREEGEQARETAREETIANRPNQYNPWGSTTWNLSQVQDPRTGEMIDQWAQTETLNPQLQAALDAQFGQTADRSEMAQGLFGDFMSNYQPIDFDQFGDPIQLGEQAQVGMFEGIDQSTSPFEYDPGAFRQQAEEAAYGKATARLDPQFQQEEMRLETKLRQQGLSPGDQAWNSAMQNFNNRRNDAYEQARLGATAQGRDESNLMFGQQLGAYQTNLGQQNQAWQQALGGYQANLAGQGQQFGQNVQQNQIANALRNQQMQEELQAQGYPLEMIQQIMAGSGIQGSSPSGSYGG